MPSIKSSVGTPLDDVPEIDDGARRRLAAVSVTTAEELLGLIAADPDGTQRLLSLGDLTRLESDVSAVAAASATPSLDEAPDEIFSTGATPPEFAEQDPVGDDVVDKRLAGGELFEAAGSPGTGADLRDCFGPIRHQGHRGTCVAHAVCALAECLERRGEGNVDLSEQHLYWNAKQHDGDPNGEGTMISVAMGRAQADGVCTEPTWPYEPDPVPGNESQGPPPEAAAQEAGGHSLTSMDALPRHDASAIRAALDDGRPVALSVPVYPNWKGNPMLKLSGFIPMPLPGSRHDGGHAMCAVGYDFDDEFTGGGYLVLRNSWGDAFAARSPVAPGHALLPFAYWEDYGWEVFVGAR